MSLRVLVSDPMSDAGLAILRESGFEVEVLTGKKPDELKAPLARVQAWLVRSATKATAELIECAPELKVIGRAGTGVDNVDVKAASRRNVIVMNVPGANTVSAAELTFALMASLARHIPRADASIRAGRWERTALAGEELCGKTLGVIGFGRIGEALAVRARAFEMKVLAYDPIRAPESAGAASEWVGLTELLQRSDFVSLHVPMTSETRGMIGAAQLSQMKKGAKLLQVSRGGVVDEAALYEALKGGHLGGAALDVFEHEPPEGSPLLTLANVVFTPHLGASTHEAQENVSTLIAEQVRDALLGRGIRNAVNLADLGLAPSARD